MLIETMPRVLGWSSSKSELERIYRAYFLLLSDSLGQEIACINKTNPLLGDELTAQLHDAPDESFSRVLTAPETSYRLLWRPTRSSGTTARFLLNAFRAEAARSGQPFEVAEVLWTAAGDMAFLPGGAVFSFPQIEGMMPLDFGSPYATKISNEGIDQDDVSTAPSEEFSEDEVALIRHRLKEAQKGIGLASPTVLSFVTTFTKVLILQKDSINPSSFSSGSSAQYVCRSLIANPHTAAVDDVDIADAIVHEAIHALLYMQEEKKKWVNDPDLYRPIPRAISPWTGQHLPLRPFLQACFVWYGLLNFWCLALSSEAFDHSRIRERIVRSGIGFSKGPLLDQIDSYKGEICPDLLRAIEEIQSIVISSFAPILDLEMEV